MATQPDVATLEQLQALFTELPIATFLLRPDLAPLAALPAQRSIKWTKQPPNGGIELRSWWTSVALAHPGNPEHQQVLTSFVVQIAGVEAAKPCSRCRYQQGEWSTCVIPPPTHALKTWWACANCHRDGITGCCDLFMDSRQLNQMKSQILTPVPAPSRAAVAAIMAAPPRPSTGTGSDAQKPPIEIQTIRVAKVQAMDKAKVEAGEKARAAKKRQQQAAVPMQAPGTNAAVAQGPVLAQVPSGVDVTTQQVANLHQPVNPTFSLQDAPRGKRKASSQPPAEANGTAQPVLKFTKRATPEATHPERLYNQGVGPNANNHGITDLSHLQQSEVVEAVPEAVSDLPQTTEVHPAIEEALQRDSQSVLDAVDQVCPTQQSDSVADFFALQPQGQAIAAPMTPEGPPPEPIAWMGIDWNPPPRPPMPEPVSPRTIPPPEIPRNRPAVMMSTVPQQQPSLSTRTYTFPTATLGQHPAHMAPVDGIKDFGHQQGLGTAEHPVDLRSPVPIPRVSTAYLKAPRLPPGLYEQGQGQNANQQDLGTYTPFPEASPDGSTEIDDEPKSLTDECNEECLDNSPTSGHTGTSPPEADDTDDDEAHQEEESDEDDSEEEDDVDGHDEDEDHEDDGNESEDDEADKEQEQEQDKENRAPPSRPPSRPSTGPPAQPSSRDRNDYPAAQHHMMRPQAHTIHPDAAKVMTTKEDPPLLRWPVIDQEELAAFRHVAELMDQPLMSIEELESLMDQQG